MSKLSNGKCVRCGCDDIRFLEVNHINGGGTQYYRKSKSYNQGAYKIYRDIIDNKVDCTELEVLCRVCNAAHYLELKYSTKGFKVLWQ